MRTRVKICGITRAHDAEVAARAGADAIGMVFWSGSRRAVSVETARTIVTALPPFVASVALFVDPDEAEVRQVLDIVAPDLLQFHGAETEEFCARFGLPYLKAIRIDGRAPEAELVGAYPRANALLFDTQDPLLAGGSGRCFDWTLLPARAGQPFILAGGLNADNVATAIRSVRPYAVDVSSGVEQAPGIKDARRVHEFMSAVAAENSRAED